MWPKIYAITNAYYSPIDSLLENIIYVVGGNRYNVYSMKWPTTIVYKYAYYYSDKIQEKNIISWGEYLCGHSNCATDTIRMLVTHVETVMIYSNFL